MPEGLAVTTNQAGGSADAPTSPVASQTPQASPEAAPPAGGPPPNLSKLSPQQRMLASLKAGRAAATPAPVPTKDTPAPAPDAPLDPVAAKVAEVAKKLEVKRAKEAAEREAASKQAGTAELEAKIAAARLDPQLLRSEKGRDHLQAWSAATGVDPIALFDALADLGEEMERESKGKPEPVEKRVEKLERERAEKLAKEAAEAQAAREANARKAFLGSVTAEMFPLLSALGEDEIMARGIAAAKVLAKAGEDPDAETIAALAEMGLRELQGKIAAKGSGTTKTAGSAEPRTLSSSLGGETPEPPKFDSGKDGPLMRMKAHMQRTRG